MLQPREGSLFAILARSPWWVSLLIAGALFAVMRYFLPAVLAATTTLPFIGLACYAGWRQFKEPSAKSVKDTLDKICSMRWPDFKTVIADRFRRDGYEIAFPKSGPADLELRKDGYTTLVSGKRWKVANAGIAQLRELADAVRASDAREGWFITAGALTETARTFAVAQKLRVIEGPELARLIGRTI
jgi:restriction system protein